MLGRFLFYFILLKLHFRVLRKKISLYSGGTVSKSNVSEKYRKVYATTKVK